MTIAIIGAGPVGQVVCAALAAAGHQVILVEIDGGRREQVRSHGIRLTGEIEQTTSPSELLPSIEELEEREIDAVFVAVKATATPLVAAAVADVVDEGSTIVSWQNGIDTERALATHLDPSRIVRAVVNFGVSFKEDGTVFVAFHHPPHLVKELSSGVEARAESIAELLSDAGLETRRSSDLETAVWQKGALNAALNAVCALTGLTIRDVWNDAFGGDLARKVLREAITVARANEIALGSGFYRFALDYLDRAGSHRPSMLLDIDAGRRTEIDYINGKIVEYGGISGIPTPYNETLVALVKSAERSSRMEVNALRSKK